MKKHWLVFDEIDSYHETFDSLDRAVEFARNAAWNRKNHYLFIYEAVDCWGAITPPAAQFPLDPASTPVTNSPEGK